ncbi:DUF6199 family natural product biosynthesis protein [Anaerocolumna sp. MB42-C2]|uniref:DUF6199 family natural product biosynthesis protein n=1 Tax=Anaerocolumna sp. MB42-C2 TaxID=3070997 RepID=UPI0027E019FF|nr:DUF6199 family natural product biosynthesis protein [Anaerocolumna sp. MB42-C2]WMJ87435.1 hypothetical protein RBU59_25920 [Anaerocolumna sp. MB42-C2]
MEVMLGIFLFVIGALMLVKPKSVWRIAESWKLKTFAEPTDLYIILIRIAGCILVIGGIFAILQM